MGLMFNKIIPMEMLAQLPLPFVHRLRDIRIKQLEEAHKQQEAAMRRNKSAARSGTPSIPVPAGLDPGMFNGTPYDDIIDELT